MLTRLHPLQRLFSSTGLAASGTGTGRSFCAIPPRRSRSAVWTEGKDGLFGQGLRNSHDYPKLAEEVTQRMQVLVDRIHRYPGSKATLHWMDDLSDEICRLVDPATIVMEAHDSSHWRRAANLASNIVVRKMEEINADTVIGKKLQSIRPDSSFSQEDIRLLHTLVGDMIPVDAKDSSRFVELQREISETQEDFMALTNEESLPDAWLVLPRQLAQLLPRNVPVTAYEHDRDFVRLQLDLHTCQRVMTHCGDEYIRYLVYVASSTSSSLLSMEPFDRLTQLRQELAESISHNSFLEAKLSDSLVKSPTQLVRLLAGILKAAGPKIQDELVKLSKLKETHLKGSPSPNQTLMDRAAVWQSAATYADLETWSEGLDLTRSELEEVIQDAQSKPSRASLVESVKSAFKPRQPPLVCGPQVTNLVDPHMRVRVFVPELGCELALPFHLPLAPSDAPELGPTTTVADSATPDTARIYPWDIKYYIRQAREKSGVNTTGACSVLSPYLSMGNCLQGMKAIAELVFNCRMEIVPVDDSARWTRTPSGSLKECRIYDRDTDELLGLIVLDMHGREPKVQTAACRVVQAGRIQRSPQPELDLETAAVDVDPSRLQAPVCSYQTPVVALLTSLEERPSWEHFVVLFHEFGHALHHVFGTSAYQHHSGLRAELECAETPSTFMEFVVTDHQLLSKFLVHSTTRQPISPALVNAANAAATDFAGIELQELLLHAIFDVVAHANPEEKLRLTREVQNFLREDELCLELEPDLTASSEPPSLARLRLHPSEAALHSLETAPIGSTHVALRTEIGRTLSPMAAFPAIGDMRHLRAVHLVEYGAQMYSYVLCRIVARTVWTNVFKEQALTLGAGTRWRQEVLRHGGGHSWRSLLTRLLQGSRIDARPAAWWET